MIRSLIKANTNCSENCSLRSAISDDVSCEQCNMKSISGVLIADLSISKLHSNRTIRNNFTGWKRTNHEYVINFLKNHGTKQTQILDVGAGSHNLSEIYQEIDKSNYYTLDIDNKDYVDIVCDLTVQQPLSETFDVIICLNVMEHIFEIDNFLTNCLGMLKPGGHFVFSVPYHSAMHFLPNDYFRYSYMALRNLMTNHNLLEIDLESVHMGYNPWASLNTYKQILRSQNTLLSKFSGKILNILILAMRVIYKINGKINISGHYSVEDEINNNTNPQLKLKAIPIGFSGTFQKLQ